MSQKTLLEQLIEVCHELKAIAILNYIMSVKENTGTPEGRAECKVIIEKAQNILNQFES